MTHTEHVNVADIERFLSFLDSDKEVFNYMLFDDKAKKPVPGQGICFGSKTDIFNHIKEMNGHIDYSLHVTLNRSSLAGRKNKDMEAARVACVDLDKEISGEHIKQIVAQYAPHLVVRSSPGKYHIYWKLKQSSDLKEWSDLQLGLSYLLHGDSDLAKISHCIRVPGVERICKSGEKFMPVIAYYNWNGEQLEYADMLQNIPELEGGIEQAKLAQGKKRREMAKLLSAEFTGSKLSLDVVSNGFPSAENLAKLALEENRNSTLYAVVRSAVYNAGGGPLGAVPASDSAISIEFASEIARLFNAQLGDLNPKGSLEDSEVEATCLSAWAAAVEARKDAAERKLKRQEANKVKVAELMATGLPVNPAVVPQEPENEDEEMAQDGVGGDEMEGARGTPMYHEVALAERVLERFGDSLIKIGDGFYVYNQESAVWEKQTRGNSSAGKHLVSQCLDGMIREPGFAQRFASTREGISPVKLEAAIASWKTGVRLNAVYGLVRDSIDVPVFNQTPFDSDPYKFFCANGVLNLLTGELTPPTPQDYLLRRSSVGYDCKAVCPWWLSFLSEVFRDNTDTTAVIEFLQEVFGYTLTGSVEEQMLFIHYGPGANGKSRILSALATLMGSYLGRLQPDSLGTKKNNASKMLERVAAKAEGRRCVTIDDLDTGMEWNEGLVKSLTEKVIVARNLYEEERDIPNTAKLHISCNQIPSVENSSHAVYRRLAILEYSRQFEINPAKYTEIERGIEREKSGILNWAIQGLARIKSAENKRITYPQEVMWSIQEYEESNSSKEQLILTCVDVLGPEEDEWISINEIHKILKRSGMFPIRELEAMKLDGLGMLLGRVKAAKRRIQVKGKRETQYRIRLKQAE